MIKLVINTALIIGVYKAAYRSRMPETYVRIGDELFTVYIDLNKFCVRWQQAMMTNRFLPVGPKIWANPHQIMLAWEKR